jgi:hypothetical protein
LAQISSRGAGVARELIKHSGQVGVRDGLDDALQGLAFAIEVGLRFDCREKPGIK